MRHRPLVLLALGVSLMAGAVHAQSITVLKAKSYLNVATGDIVAPALIVITGDRITSINPAVPPRDAQVIELPEMSLLPGLIDVHTHLSYQIEPGWETEALTWTVGEFALRSGKNARKTLLAGFTTIREVGSPGFADVATMKAIERGDIIGPHIIPSGHAISTTGGHCDYNGYAPSVIEGDYRSGIADGAEEIRKAIRYQIKYGAKSIKICATASVLTVGGPAGAQQFSEQELAAAADEAHRHGLKIAAHAHGTDGIIAATRAGIDFIEHSTMLDARAAALIKARGAWVSPNLYLIDKMASAPMSPDDGAKVGAARKSALASFALAMTQGLKISLGTDAGVYPHGENARELTARVLHGMTPIEAIRSATVYSAEALGTTDRGQVKPGLLADLIAVKGNPLQDISLLQDIPFVMKGGIVYKKPE